MHNDVWLLWLMLKTLVHISRRRLQWTLAFLCAFILMQMTTLNMSTLPQNIISSSLAVAFHSTDKCEQKCIRQLAHTDLRPIFRQTTLTKKLPWMSCADKNNQYPYDTLLSQHTAWKPIALAFFPHNSPCYIHLKIHIVCILMKEEWVLFLSTSSMLEMSLFSVLHISNSRPKWNSV